LPMNLGFSFFLALALYFFFGFVSLPSYWMTLAVYFVPDCLHLFAYLDMSNTMHFTVHLSWLLIFQIVIRLSWVSMFTNHPMLQEIWSSTNAGNLYQRYQTSRIYEAFCCASHGCGRTETRSWSSMRYRLHVR
jgi:hypothetical protein